jgi:hypothetical protein
LAEDLKRIKPFLEWIKVLKQQGLTGFGIVVNYLHHQVQPLKARERYGFEYAGAEDPSRIVPTQELTKEDVLGHLRKILKDVSVIPHKVGKYTAEKLPPTISLLLCSSKVFSFISFA